jgi:hypothetical protein
MNSYIGAKIINAELSNLNEYRIKKYGKDKAVLSEEGNNIKGYIVVYPPIGSDNEPYISWSPKEVFEKAYRLIDNSEKSLMLSSPYED